MRNDSGETTSVWMLEDTIESDGELRADAKADVCIVGGGIAGMSSAYMLAHEGKKVIVLEDGEIGGRMTARTTAHISNAYDDRFSEIEQMFGEDAAKIAAESHTAAIDTIEKIVREEDIKCDLKRLDGYLFVPPGGSMDVLEDEIKAAHRAGLSNVEWADRAPIDKFDTGRCLRFPDQAQFHPLKYINGLAQAVRRMGGKLHTENHVATVKAENGGIRVKTDSGHVVFADAAIVATNTPINDLVVMHTKQAPYITYVIGLTAAKGEIREALFWDTGDPYHYVRLAPDPKDDEREILIVGGEDHKTGQAKDSEDRFRRLEAWARERFPMAGGVAYRWSGQVMEPVDLMGFIGPNPLDDENIYIATGDSGNGITNGTIAGILLTDLIHGRENPWESLYDPGRVTISSAGTFAKENLNVAGQYTDLVTGGEVASIDEIPNESGAIIRDGLSKLAVYRDASGRVHKLSAVCTHLGCIVAWNPGESSWDCPCHGSRFDKFGKVFQGPANSDLSPSTD